MSSLGFAAPQGADSQPFAGLLCPLLPAGPPCWLSLVPAVSSASVWPALDLPEPRLPLQQWVMLSQCCLELGRSGKRASSRQSLLMESCFVWQSLSHCKRGFVAGSLLAFIVSSCLVLPWFPFVGCGVSPLLLGVTPWFCLRSGGRRPPCQIRPTLQNGSGSSQEVLGGGRGAVGQAGAGQGEFSGASLMAWGPLVAGETGIGPGLAGLGSGSPSACSGAGIALLGLCVGP